MTLLVSAGLLLAGAVMALRLPRVMQCVDPEQDAAAEKPVQGGAVPTPRAVERSSRVSA